MAGTGVRVVDAYKAEFLFVGVPSTTTTLYVDLAYYSHLTFFFGVTNTTGVTGSAITLSQASAVAGTGSKALTYNNYFAGLGGYALQTAASDVLTQVTGVAGTFTTATTSSVNFLYAIEVHDTDLDLNNGFTCVRANLATAVNATIAVFVLGGVARYGGNYSINPSALT
jgi:hypothetical protein